MLIMKVQLVSVFCMNENKAAYFLSNLLSLLFTV